MPFITPDRRRVIDECRTECLDAIQPGDRCYGYYKQMVDRWKADPRWTTAHEICKATFADTSGNDDDDVAKFLAWNVFFQIYVMPYEQRKRAQNGDI